jgi:hypothetical protein
MVEPVERVIHDGSAKTLRADVITITRLGELFGVAGIIVLADDRDGAAQ